MFRSQSPTGMAGVIVIVLCAACMPAKAADQQSLNGKLITDEFLGSVVDVQKDLADGADVDARGSDGNTALMNAAYDGHTDIVRLLLEHKADVNAKGYNGYTPLYWAATHGDAGTVRLLFEHGADVNARTNQGDTALMYAARAGQVDMARLLLDRGADVNLKDAYGRTAQDQAGKHPEIVSLLAAHGAAPNNGKLMVDARAGDTEAVRQDIAAGADVNSKHADGQTALMMAASADAARLLLEHHADVNATDNKGMTPLIWAATMGRDDVARVLIERGAHVDAKANDGATALMDAAALGHADVVSLLLDQGADVNTENNLGTTAVQMAGFGHHSDVAALLVAHGARQIPHRPTDWSLFFTSNDGRQYYYSPGNVTHDGALAYIEWYGTDAQGSVIRTEINCSARTMRNVLRDVYDAKTNDFVTTNDWSDFAPEAIPPWPKLGAHLAQLTC